MYVVVLRIDFIVPGDVRGYEDAGDMRWFPAYGVVETTSAGFFVLRISRNLVLFCVHFTVRCVLRKTVDGTLVYGFSCAPIHKDVCLLIPGDGFQFIYIAFHLKCAMVC